MDPVVYTADELVKMIRIPKSSIYQLTRQGRIPGAMKIGRNWRYLKTTIDRWLAEKGGQRDL